MTFMKRMSETDIDFSNWSFATDETFDEKFQDIFDKQMQRMMKQVLLSALQDEPPDLTVEARKNRTLLTLSLPFHLSEWIFYKVDLVKIFKEWTNDLFDEDEKKVMIRDLHKIIKMLEKEGETK